MKNPTLQRGSTLRDDIERLQLALDELGYSVDIDARFGPGVEREVRAFQAANDLPADGVVETATWRALTERSRYGRPPEIDVAQLLGFRGDVAWIHRWEGHAGRPYWPGGASGVTLDPGLDLGHAAPELVEQAFASRLEDTQMEAVRRVSGKRGEEAKKALGAEPDLQSIRVLRLTATEIFPVVAKPYWTTLCRRFATLEDPSTPGSVHTAMLSLGYNRGAGNRDLALLSDPLARADWHAVAEAIASMQQDHELEGIRRRRRAEGDLIKSAAG